MSNFHNSPDSERVPNSSVASNCKTILLRFSLYFITINLLVFGSWVSAKVPHYDFKGNSIDLGIWHQDYLERCYLPKQQNSLKNESLASIQSLLALIVIEPEIGQYLVSTIQRSNTGVCLEEMNNGALGYYDYSLNIISLKDTGNVYEQAIVLAHELRHVDLAFRGYSRSINYDVYEMARLNAASEADAQAITVWFAWQMKEFGNPELWNTISELVDYADIAASFSDVMKNQGVVTEALRVAFIQWYKSSSRVNGYETYATENYLSVLKDTDRLQSYRLLPRNYFYSFCLLPSGVTYKCELTQELQRPYGPF